MAPDGEMQHFSDDSANITSAPTTVKINLDQLLCLFREVRSFVIRGDEIVQGILPGELDAAGPEVRRLLDGTGGTHFLHETSARTAVSLVRPVETRPPERWWLHLLLGLTTLLTTTIAGAYFLGQDPLRLKWLDLGAFWLPVPVGIRPAEIPAGLLFS